MMLLLPGITLVAVILGIVIYLPLATRLWLDTPNARSSHHKPTPSSAGVVVVPVLVAVLLGAWFSGFWAVGYAECAALGGAAALCALGARDDRRSLSVRVRLLVQFAAAASLVTAYGLFSLFPLNAIVLVIALVWLVNLYNFMDGIDGLAALQCVLSAATLGALGYLAGASAEFVMASAVVGAAYLGFLVFNLPPARLFMGDAGSLPAGLLLGWLGLWSALEGWLEPVVWLILMSPFLLDTGITLLRRRWRGEVLAQAHREHFYQRLARRYGSHGAVDRRLLVLHGLWLVPLAASVVLDLLPQWTAGALSLFPQLLLMAKWRRLE